MSSQHKYRSMLKAEVMLEQNFFAMLFHTPKTLCIEAIRMQWNDINIFVAEFVDFGILISMFHLEHFFKVPCFQSFVIYKEHKSAQHFLNRNKNFLHWCDLNSIMAASAITSKHHSNKGKCQLLYQTTVHQMCHPHPLMTPSFQHWIRMRRGQEGNGQGLAVGHGDQLWRKHKSRWQQHTKNVARSVCASLFW